MKEPVDLWEIGHFRILTIYRLWQGCPLTRSMGCVGSKQEHPKKGGGKEEAPSRTLTPHYVKDPTMGNSATKPVSWASTLWESSDNLKLLQGIYKALLQW